MTGAPWALGALLCWQLGASGGLPKEMPAQAVRGYARGERQVRVLIVRNASHLTLRPRSVVRIEAPDTGERLATVLAGAAIAAGVSQGQVAVRAGRFRAQRPRVMIAPASREASTVVSVTGRGRRGVYSGSLEIAVRPAGMQVVEHVDAERYVAGVVAAELPRGFPQEAQRAQAIAARTYALFHLGDHEAEGADVCSEVHCQAYRGAVEAESRASRAAEDTAGLALAWNGMLAEALYHSACGGATAAAWDVRQGKVLPYLCGTPDRGWGDDRGEAYCGQEHSVRWTKRFSHRQAGRLVARNLGTVTGRPGLSAGRLRSLRVAATKGRRVQWLEVETSTGTYLVRGDAIRWLFGTGRPGIQGLRSTAFTLAVRKDRRGNPVSYVFQGAGHGHGIGLCQWGARGRANQGQSAAEILAAYYPGTEVVDLRAG